MPPMRPKICPKVSCISLRSIRHHSTQRASKLSQALNCSSSDVLKRHVENHPQDYYSSRPLIPCNSCHERKSACDTNTPCQSCIRDSTKCERNASGQEDTIITGLNSVSSDCINGIGANDQNIADTLIGMTHMSALGTSDGQGQHWLDYPQPAWSQPFPPPGLIAPSQSDANVQDNAQWPVHPDELGPIQVDLSAPASEGSPFHLPFSNDSQTHSLSDGSWTMVDQTSRSTSACTADTSASSAFSHCDNVTKLRNCLEKDSIAAKKFIELYFAEIDPYWPILHAPSFNISGTSPVLLASMLTLVSWLEGNLDHVKLAPLVFDGVIAVFLVGESVLSCR